MKARKGEAMGASETKARVIINPSSGGGTYDPDQLRDELSGFELDWVETEGPEDAKEAAGDLHEGLLIVIGGDGTINDVVNGLGNAGFPEGVTLALLPAGTGNDLAATLAVPENPDEAEDVIRQHRVRTLDVAHVRSEKVGERYFINVATGGLGAEISDANDEETKNKWGKLSYLRASLQVARGFDVREVVMYLDDKEHRVRAVNMAIGNCRYAGGGWLAAPKANPEDGLLDVVVVEDVGLKEILTLAPTALAKSDYLDKEGVFFIRAKEIRIETRPGLEFTVDGEVIGDDPAEFTVIPQALKVIVGPEYTPDPRDE
ncbi:MAG: diacylglycerol kinase family lipid kinase [Actinomycetota bacterium]|nr:diacylglycerol kinase family lipid kinase [Actinomycetota bacterium]